MERLNEEEKERLYKEHMLFNRNIYYLKDINDSDLLTQFELLLSLIPNEGKFYKFRSFCGKSFKNAYDGLEKGYMWFPTAATLNDDYDSILITDANLEFKHLVDSIFEDKNKMLYCLVRQRGQYYWERETKLNEIPFDSIMQCFDKDTKELSIEKVKNLLGSGEKLDCFYSLESMALADLREAMKQTAEIIFSYNSVLQNDLHVFSMSESYDLDNMWAYYADSGRGFCIEYDYNKAKEFGTTTMKYLLNTYRVEYDKAPAKMLSDYLAEQALEPNFDMGEFLTFMMERILKKDPCWKNEKEWRISLGNTDCKLPIDIVSAIIIDERSLEKTNAKKLIRLCKKHGWEIKVRKRHPVDTKHIYEIF